MKKNGILEMFTFLYYVNEESNVVIGGSTKTAQDSIENKSKNIIAVVFKCGARSVHHKRNEKTPFMPLL